MLGNVYAPRSVAYIWGLIALLRALYHLDSIVSVPTTLITVAILAFFCTALGTFCSLVCRTTTRAVATTAGILIFCGGGYLFCCAPLMIGSQGGGEIILAPCATFLLYMSTTFWVFSRYSGPHSTEIAAAIIGNIVYLFAAIGLIIVAISGFDSANGRIPMPLPSPLDIDSVSEAPAPGEAQSPIDPPPTNAS